MVGAALYGGFAPPTPKHPTASILLNLTDTTPRQVGPRPPQDDDPDADEHEGQERADARHVTKVCDWHEPGEGAYEYEEKRGSSATAYAILGAAWRTAAAGTRAMAKNTRDCPSSITRITEVKPQMMPRLIITLSQGKGVRSIAVATGAASPCMAR
jgi:hypothetical protein